MLFIIGSEKKQSGNIQPKETIRIEYLNDPKPPFKQTKSERRIVFNPHQTKTLSDPDRKYEPLDLECPFQEIECICIRGKGFDLFDELADSSGAQSVLLWLDPRSLKTECLASFIVNWKKRLPASKNVALAVVIPKGRIKNKDNPDYKIWKADVSGPSFSSELTNPIWYPSLAIDAGSLEQASKILKPYDVFPLVEFPDIVIQMGEHTLTNHAALLEQCRARTRNFIYLDVQHPDRAFDQFYKTLKALPRLKSSVFQPVITPGGSNNCFLVSLLSGILADAYFLTPHEEILMYSNAENQGIMILRKCT